MAAAIPAKGVHVAYFDEWEEDCSAGDWALADLRCDESENTLSQGEEEEEEERDYEEEEREERERFESQVQ